MSGFLINTQEQNNVDLVFVQPRLNSNVVLTNMSIGKAANLFDGFNQIYDTAATYSYGKFRFRGRRIGILLNFYSTFGILGFDIDGTDYGTYDLSKFAPAAPNTQYNVPYMIATDLPDGDHVLTFTKLNANPISISGFMVENSANVQTFMRTGFNYHDMLDNTGVGAAPTAIGTTDTSIRTIDTWAHTIVLTNTTASPINVTLKSNTATIIGPFPVPANDIKQISGPIFFKAAVKAIASATGVNIYMGVQ